MDDCISGWVVSTFPPVENSVFTDTDNLGEFFCGQVALKSVLSDEFPERFGLSIPGYSKRDNYTLSSIHKAKPTA